MSKSPAELPSELGFVALQLSVEKAWPGAGCKMPARASVREQEYQFDSVNQI